MMTTNPGTIVDQEALGRRIRAARVLAGFDNMADLTAAIRETGLQISDRTLYALERGEQPITWEILIALVLSMQPPGGVRFFWPVIADRHIRRFMELSLESEPSAIERAADRAYLDAAVDLTRERAR